MPEQSPGDHRFSRRTAIRVTAGGLVGTAVHLSSGSMLAAGLQQSPAATPDGSAKAPLDEHLAWFVDAVNNGGESLTEADIEEHMAPSFLQVMPPDQAIGMIQGLAAGFGTIAFEGVTRPPTETQAVALMSTGAGVPLAVPISIENAAPFGITGLYAYPVPTATGEPLLPEAPFTVATFVDVDVDGRAVYLTDSGTEGPTVILESGLMDSGAPWAGLIPDIATFARVVSYDRPNTMGGASDPVPTPRTAADLATDLHALLENAAIPGPYVLVGHSLGGMVARLYAGQYPDEVAGMVLIDATHEDQLTGLTDILTPELLALVSQTANPEGIDVETSLMQIAAARTETPVPPMPLVAISAETSDPAGWPPGWPLEEANQLHHELQEDLANLVPGGKLVVAAQSGHYVHQIQPDLVLDAIRQVVQAVEDPSSWATPAATPIS